MKRIFYILLILLSNSEMTYSQWQCSMALNFGTIEDSIYVAIDTTNNPNNIWQIGAPQKTVFSSSLGPASIVTDTINPYPINDTSSFIVKHAACIGFIGNGIASLQANYFVDCDSLNDYGKIEFSPDNGLSWVMISDDTTIYNFSPWPTYINQGTFTGASNGWKSFGINLWNLQYIFNINIDDTVLFKFTFISDGTFDARDGLMFDNIEIIDEFVWGITENNVSTLTIFPNPASTEIQIQNINIPIETIKIYSMDGRLVYLQNNPNQNKIPIEFLENGTYQILVETNDGKFLTSRFVKL